VFNSNISNSNDPYSITGHNYNGCCQIGVGFFNGCITACKLIKSKKYDIVSSVIEYLVDETKSHTPIKDIFSFFTQPERTVYFFH